MAKKRLSETEIKGILEEVANGAKPTDLAKKHGFSLGSFYNWKNKYEGGAKKKPAAKKAGRPAKKAAAKPAAKKRGRPAKKAAATPAAKPAAKKRGRPAKKAAAAPAAKPAAKKRGRPAKKTTARRGRPAKAASTPVTSNKKADTLFKKIQSLEAQIEKAKIAYANAILGK